MALLVLSQVTSGGCGKIGADNVNIQWAPEPFVFNRGSSVRYIDFERGDDHNSGKSRENPWKHHPWDQNAIGKAAKCRGVHTYCFKKGVVYRGQLTAMESGKENDPIRLTVDPSWGDGDAYLYGSKAIKGGWRRCTDDACPQIPTSERITVWYRDYQSEVSPRMLWEINGDNIKRIHLAREPDWHVKNPDDPRNDWSELTDTILELKLYMNNATDFRVGDKLYPIYDMISSKRIKNIFSREDYIVRQVGIDHIIIEVKNWKVGALEKGLTVSNGRNTAVIKKLSGRYDVISRIIDRENFEGQKKEDWINATIWSEQLNMPKPVAGKVIDFNAEELSLKVRFNRGTWGPGKYCRYYAENLPRFLDDSEEFYYLKRKNKNGRLFLSLADNKDPNTTFIEAANYYRIIEINSLSNISISGLDIKFNNSIEVGSKQAEHASIHSSAIGITGTCSNISISNLQISHVTAGIVGHAKANNDVIDNISITGNDIHDLDGCGIAISNGRFHKSLMNSGSRVIHVNVRKNRVVKTGSRVLDSWGIGKHAIEVSSGELVRICENVVNTCWGAGILLYNGAEYSRGQIERPLIRNIISGNMVSNSLLGLQDYGGIASWMAGPVYIFNNVSINPVGYKHVGYMRSKKRNNYRSSSFGVGIYLDSQIKAYVFKNTILGKNNNVNDRIYNSTGVNEAMGFMNAIFKNTIEGFAVGFHKGMYQHNRCFYIGNRLNDISTYYFLHEPMPSVIDYPTLAYSRNLLEGAPSKYAKLGKEQFKRKDDLQRYLSNVSAIENGVEAAVQEFSREAIWNDHSVYFFVPWGLFKVVGEWNFYQNRDDASVIIGENLNWNSEWQHRMMMDEIPRNNLYAHGFRLNDYHYGILENWTKGALHFNGTNQYCSLSAMDSTKAYNWQSIKCNNFPCKGRVLSEQRESLDIGKGNFLVEMVINVPKLSPQSTILHKRVKNKGYEIYIDSQGFINASLHNNSLCSRTSAIAINDDVWHHVVVEVIRNKKEGINLYIDGALSNASWDGVMIPHINFENKGDFIVGRSVKKNNYFKGFIDYLRISKGSLEDSETTIDQLYKWEILGDLRLQ
jgi:hypothetical protein